MTTERSPEQKAQALAIYAEHGLARAHHDTGVPRSTLHGWARAAGLDTQAIAGRTVEQTQAATLAHEYRCAELRVELRELLLVESVDMLERMNATHKDFKGAGVVEVTWDTAPAGACKDYAVAAAVLLDKYRLEVGEATSRDEHHVSDVRERATALLDELAQRRGEGGRGVSVR